SRKRCPGWIASKRKTTAILLVKNKKAGQVGEPPFLGIENAQAGRHRLEIGLVREPHSIRVDDDRMWTAKFDDAGVAKGLAAVPGFARDLETQMHAKAVVNFSNLGSDFRRHDHRIARQGVEVFGLASGKTLEIARQLLVGLISASGQDDTQA